MNNTEDEYSELLAFWNLTITSSVLGIPLPPGPFSYDKKRPERAGKEDR